MLLIASPICAIGLWLISPILWQNSRKRGPGK
jgi:hypothetical protein